MSERKLPDPVAQVLCDPVDEAVVPRMWPQIEARRARRALELRSIFVWASLGAALAVVVMLSLNALVARPSAAHFDSTTSGVVGPLTLRGGGPVVPVGVAPGAAPAVVDLADGSRIVVDGDSRLEPLASSPRDFVVKLVRGCATFDVEPGGPRRWVVEAGLASVEVVGTRFVVTRKPDVVRVEVLRGVVLVRGATVPDGIARLEHGATLDVHAIVAPADAPAEPVPVAAGATKVSARPMVAATKSVWRDDAEHGKYADAYAALGPDGLRLEAAHAESADDLMTLSDIARLSGHANEALDPLDRLLSAHASSPLASLAAFTLGRIQLDLGQMLAASGSLERALRMGVPAGLAEDAYARLVEADVKAGNRAAAGAVAGEYSRRFPAGRRTTDIARWLQQ